MAKDLLIRITATDSASNVFEEVGTAGKDMGKNIDEGASTASDALDKAVDAVRPLKPAVDEAVNAVRPLPAALDEVGTAARDAATPLNDAGAGAGVLGVAIGDVGDKIGGASGNIVKGLGDIVAESERTGTAVDKAALGLQVLKGAAVAAGLVLGPIVMGAALSAASWAVGELAGMLGGGDGLADRLEQTRANAAELNAEILETAAGIENAGQALRLFEGGSAVNQMVEDFARLIEIQAVFRGGNPAGDFASGAVPGITSYNQAMAEAIALTGEYGLSTEDVVHGNADLTGTLDSLAESQAYYNQLLAVAGPGQEAVRTRLAELITQLQNGEISTEEFNAQLEWMVTNLNAAYVAPALAAEALAQFSKAAYDASVNVGLLNTAAEQLQAAGLDSLALNVAIDLDRSALESTFDIIVGGTNRLAESSQAVADWADSLANAEDGLSVLGELYQEGLIGLDQYTAGMAANTSIQEDNAAIQQEIQAIQAGHLPLMAELTEQQRQYIEGLGDLSAEQQLAALGFMDSAQSAKAMELAYLAADAASGNLGDTGEATASKIIEAAAQADPVMKQMLLDMGLISEGADGTITVNFPTASSVTASVDALKESIDALTLALGGIPPNVHTTITASDNASGVISQVSAALANLDGSSATVYVRGQNWGITEAAATGRTIAFNTAPAVRGIPAFAGGGTLALVGEAGPELVRLPTGAQVTSNPASRTVLANVAQRGDAGVVFNGPVTLSVQRDGTAQEAIRRAALARARGY